MVSMARLVVTAVLVEGRAKAEVARTYGVSRRWVIELVRRYQTDGAAGLVPRSRRPKGSPSRTPDEVEDQIVALRKHLTEIGVDAGAHTIAFHLQRSGTPPPSVATIWRILKRRGFVTPQPQKRPRSSFVRFQADQPNERWQADITHWTLGDGTDVEICNWLDDHSRYNLRSTARRVHKAAHIVQEFHDAARDHGFPAQMLTDNGAVFSAATRGGRCAFESELIALSIRYVNSRPYHPQTCGKVERFHQTQKQWLNRRPRARTVAELQTQLDTFRDYYNQVRPHRALDRRTPAEAYAARPKAAPTGPGLTLPPHARVRRDKIDTTGVITLRHNSKLHHIGLGRAHAGTRVLVLVVDLNVRVLTEDGQLLRELVLDPTRDYQRQA